MISVLYTQEFVPSGRQLMLQHPGELIGVSGLNEAESIEPLAEQLRNIDLCNSSPKEWWMLRPSPTIEDSEEELYIKNKTVVWSKGVYMRWLTDRCFTSEYRVKMACWANFDPNPSLHQSTVEYKEKQFPAICVVDTHNINVYAEDGRDYITNSQISISSVWPNKFGVLLEREISNQSISRSSMLGVTLPTIFSLQHPYDEIAPVLAKKNGISFMSDIHQKVVFTSTEPSLCMLYDSITGFHSVWSIRKATMQESCIVRKDEEFSSSMALGPNSPAANNSFMSGSPMFLQRSRADSFSQSRRQSIAASFSVPNSSPTPSRHQSGLSTPVTPSRKPSFSESIEGPGGSPRRRNSVDVRSPLCPANLDFNEACQPLYPELCMEHLWTEPAKIKESMTTQTGATKVFLSTDLTGETRLCYMVPSRKELGLVRLEQTNQQEQLIFGTVSTIPARDAAPLTGLNMIVVIDLSNNVVLYTGSHFVSKVHMRDFCPQPPLHSNTHLSQSQPSTSSNTNTPGNNEFSSPIPRRSSMRPESTFEGSYFPDASCLLSPVPQVDAPGLCCTGLQLDEPQVQTNSIQLRDATTTRVTLEYSYGFRVRVTMPEMCSSMLVRECLNTLKSVLKKDVAMLLMIKWYSSRNAPGSQNITADTEWLLFIGVLLNLLGYDVERIPMIHQLNGGDAAGSSVPLEKRQRRSAVGTQEDLDWVLTYFKSEIKELCIECHLDMPIYPEATVDPESSANVGRINSSAPLFQNIPLVLSSLHLLYEELKLDSLMHNGLCPLVQVCSLLALDLQLPYHHDIYWRDFPAYCNTDYLKVQQMLPVDREKLGPYKQGPPPSIFSYFQALIECTDPDKLPPPFPYIPQINPRTRDIVQLTALLTQGTRNPHLVPESFIRKIVPPGNRINTLTKKVPKTKVKGTQSNIMEKAVLMMVDMGLTREKIECLPASIALLIHGPLTVCRENPPPDWPEAAYKLVAREDLAALFLPVSDTAFLEPVPKIPVPSAPLDPNIIQLDAPFDEPDDGMECIDQELLKKRFSVDHRVAKVRRMLHSSTPVKIHLSQRPEVSDHDFIEEQERQLYAMCTRTMALPVGRGMFSLGTMRPVVLEPLAVPKLCLTGRSPVRGTTIDLTHIEVVPNMNLWPLFHNGVAAGLRISPSAPGINSTWIGYNKPKGSADSQTEHAGFLMALGLTGHLNSVDKLKLYDYLKKCQEMTSVGLLLGIAASKRGTMDPDITRIISLHVEAMLPPTSLELDLAQNIQVAALLSLGLVYQESAHRHITEVLLSEIGRPPGPEMENSVDRESYSLAAGLALGLVVLGQGEGQMSGLRDLAIPDTLHHYMVGGHARPLTGYRREKYRTPSYQIREGDYVNVDVTGPGATLALGMLYFKTGNKAVAAWMDAPKTQHLLDFVRPDFLLLRILARGLILWDDIMPNQKWVESHVPDSIRPFCFVKPWPDIDTNIDLETMNQANCNILAGACMAMGLRFAGSANCEAFETLLFYAEKFTSLLGKSVAELAGKSTIEACINVVVLSVAMVMAGSGELSVLRVCRFLRGRVGASHSVVTYGSHLATHMAMGLLFLGGGRYTLSTSPSSIAALLCAFFPKFPTHSNDNRYHLQAFRHLYVLAAEPRLLVPLDIDTHLRDFTHLRVVYLDTPWYKNQEVKLKAPCILPELHLVKEVHVEDERYWPIAFERGRNWEQLICLLENSRSLPVKKKAGCLSYSQDPLGFRTLFAQSLTSENTFCWTSKLDSILAFSSGNSLVDFAQYFLEVQKWEGDEECFLKDKLRSIVYECCMHDKPAMLPIWMDIIQGIRKLSYGIVTSFLMWQVKLLPIVAEHQSRTLLANKIPADIPNPWPCLQAPLVSLEQANAASVKAKYIIDKYEKENIRQLHNYMNSQNDYATISDQCTFSNFVIFYDIPSLPRLKHLLKPINPLSLMMQGLPSSPAMKLYQASEIVADEEQEM